MRFSQQRQQVYEVLSSTKSHPDAQWVYNKVREYMPNISLGTVYRNLNELVECGQARKVNSVDNVDRYDATVTAHGHLVCKSCGRIFDVEQPNVSEIDVDFAVDSVDVTYYGQCRYCKAG